MVLGLQPAALAPGHPAQVLLGAVAGVPVGYLDLQPLSPAAVAAMVGLRTGRSRAVALHRATGGNPFLVARASAGASAAIPEAVCDAVARRMARLPAATVAAVERLSVVPSDIDRALAVALLDGDLAALAPAETHGLIALDGGRFGFRHGVVRRAIEARIPVQRHRRLRTAAAAALLASAPRPRPGPAARPMAPRAGTPGAGSSGRPAP